MRILSNRDDLAAGTMILSLVESLQRKMVSDNGAMHAPLEGEEGDFECMPGGIRVDTWHTYDQLLPRVMLVCHLRCHTLMCDLG